MKPRIVIVGAGMAGLSAACRLREAGFTDVLVLEASGRVGGRIHTVQFGDGEFPVELGASWIHGGTRKNSVFDLAETLGILTPYRINNRMSGRFLREDGTEIDRDSVTKTWNIFQRLTSQIQTDMSNQVATGHTDPNLNLEDFYKKLINAEMENNRNGGIPESDLRTMFNTFLNYQRFHEGDDLEKIAIEEDIDIVLEGGDINIPRGYNQIINFLCGKLQHGAIRMNTEVVRIKWANVTSNRRVEIFTKNGAKIEADHIIVTCSLGYLKRHHATLFEPRLPSEKISVINSIGFGRVGKILLEFDQPITKPSNKSIIFAWDDISLAEDNSNWYRRIFGFDRVFNKENTLLGWISGKAAEHMESLSDEKIADVCVKLLRKFLNDVTIPYPRQVLVSRWCTNPYTLGAYSYHTPSLIRGEFSTMSAPLSSTSGEPVVLFAGEATDWEFYSCTHGARNSGLREAERLIGTYAGKIGGQSKL